MTYAAPAIGNEISCVMHGIDPHLLRDARKLEELALKGLEKESFTVLECIAHEFEPEGYTLVVLLAESHLAIHTYPEYGTLYFNLYSCRGEESGNQTYAWIREHLAPTSIDSVERKVKVKV